jgi:16S rRNA (adenine1518-N6/adenine1519-N6)-dimethyltransferase
MNPRQQTIKSLLETYGARPKKRLGQNFLTDKGVLERILEAADLSPHDTVVEIGPGLGILTKALAEKAKKVIAIEKDPRMVEILRKTTEDLPNIEIVQGDILGIVLNQVKHRPTSYKLISNLPYYITSPVIRKFLEARPQPKLMVLMVQKEVAQRICARPAKRGEARPSGTAKMNLLAVSVQFYAEPKIVSYVKRTSFWPSPNVDSAILRLKPILKPTIVSFNTSLQGAFFRVVKAGFKHPRKQLLNNLSKGLGVKREKIAEWLRKNNLNPAQRAETLSLQDWIRLTKSFRME